MNQTPNYLFIHKSLFFASHGILVIGDLHLGYEEMLRNMGILIPENQIKETIKEIENILTEIKKKKMKVEKIIFLGDSKHSFGYKWKEKNYFKEVYEFLKSKFKEENIILIKGNHDTIDYTYERKLKDFYIEGDIAFLHGHKQVNSIFNKEIKTVVMGHIHPSITLSDKHNIKRERYKCFLIGSYKKKEVIILPSFLNIVEGTSLNEYQKEYKNSFSIIPKIRLLNFKIYIIGDKKTYEFGTVKQLMKNKFAE